MVKSRFPAGTEVEKGKAEGYILRKAKKTQKEGPISQGSMKEFPPFRLDFVNQCLWRRDDGADEQRILLTPKAFAMLRYLVERAFQLLLHPSATELRPMVRTYGCGNSVPASPG